MSENETEILSEENIKELKKCFIEQIYIALAYVLWKLLIKKPESI